MRFPNFTHLGVDHSLLHLLQLLILLPHDVALQLQQAPVVQLGCRLGLSCLHRCCADARGKKRIPGAHNDRGMRREVSDLLTKHAACKFQIGLPVRLPHGALEGKLHLLSSVLQLVHHVSPPVLLSLRPGNSRGGHARQGTSTSQPGFCIAICNLKHNNNCATTHRLPAASESSQLSSLSFSVPSVPIFLRAVAVLRDASGPPVACFTLRSCGVHNTAQTCELGA